MSETKPSVPSEALSLLDRLKRIKGEGPLQILGENLAEAGKTEESIRQLEIFATRLGDNRIDYTNHEINGKPATKQDIEGEIAKFAAKLEGFIEQSQKGEDVDMVDMKEVEQWRKSVQDLCKFYRPKY